MGACHVGCPVPRCRDCGKVGRPHAPASRLRQASAPVEGTQPIDKCTGRILCTSMLGWDICVYREDAPLHQHRPVNLAKWSVGLNGIDWLDEMVKNGRAERLSGGGYPSRYRAQWKDLWPELLVQPTPYQGPPVLGDDYVMLAGWQGQKTVNRDEVLRCQPDDYLIVDAWDPS